MSYNRQNQLSYAAMNSGVYYQYSGGQRIRKTSIKAGNIREDRIYLGSYELYRKYKPGFGEIETERSTVHIADDTGRIAMYEALNTETNGDGADNTMARYIYSNHLGSSSLELNEQGDVISYEEYHPYGTTAYQVTNKAVKAAAKRYRYTGKERDEETGLYYHGARYYIPWLARWCAVDPLESKYSPQSPYVYCSDNPVNRVDPDGRGDKGKTEMSTPTPAVDNTGHAPVPAPQFQPPIQINTFPSKPSIPSTPSAPNDHTSTTVHQQGNDRLQSQTPPPLKIKLPAPTFAYPTPSDPISVQLRADYRAQMAFQKEMGERGALDPYAVNLATSPGVQVGLAWVLPEVSFIQGAAQIKIGLHNGDLGQVALGVMGVAGSSYSLARGGMFGYSFAPQLKSLPNTEQPISGPTTLPNGPASTFMAGQYTSRVLKQDAFLYRAGDFGNPLGQFFSEEKPMGILQVRIDKAILPIWPGGGQSKINTGFLIKIPAGTTVYEGIVAPQGGVFLGGTKQIYIPQPWNRLGVKSMSNFTLK